MLLQNGNWSQGPDLNLPMEESALTSTGLLHFGAVCAAHASAVAELVERSRYRRTAAQAPPPPPPSSSSPSSPFTATAVDPDRPPSTLPALRERMLSAPPVRAEPMPVEVPPQMGTERGRGRGRGHLTSTTSRRPAATGTDDGSSHVQPIVNNLVPPPTSGLHSGLAGRRQAAAQRGKTPKRHGEMAGQLHRQVVEPEPAQPPPRGSDAGPPPPWGRAPPPPAMTAPELLMPPPLRVTAPPAEPPGGGGGRRAPTLQEQLQQPQPPPRPPSLPPTAAAGGLPSDLAQAAAAAAASAAAQDEGGGQAPPSRNIAGWLAKLSLARYTEPMVELGVSHPSDIELVTDLELAGLGVHARTHARSQSSNTCGQCSQHIHTPERDNHDVAALAKQQHRADPGWSCSVVWLLRVRVRVRRQACGLWRSGSCVKPLHRCGSSSKIYD